MDSGLRPHPRLHYLMNTNRKSVKLDALLERLSGRGFVPDCIVKAPGRANIIGEHIDYCEGMVLPFAIEQSMYFVTKRHASDLVVINSEDYQSTWQEGQATSDSWMGYIQQVLVVVRKNNLLVTGCEVYITSDIPIGAGVSSSSALCCGFLYVLNEINKWQLGKNELIAMASEAEYGLGLRGGKMDQYSIFYGEEGSAVLLDCRDHTYRLIEIDQAVFQFVLLDSGVQHSLVHSDYNSRRDEVERALAQVREVEQEAGYRSITSRHIDLLAEHSVERKRLRHVYSEINRVGLAVAAIEQKDPIGLGQLFFKSHYSLRDDYEVSCPEIDWLIAYLEQDRGIYGARMMGGGFGGSVICLVKEKGFHNSAPLARLYEKNFGRRLQTYPVQCAIGVTPL